MCLPFISLLFLEIFFPFIIYLFSTQSKLSSSFDCFSSLSNLLNCFFFLQLIRIFTTADRSASFCLKKELVETFLTSGTTARLVQAPSPKSRVCGCKSTHSRGFSAQRGTQEVLSSPPPGGEERRMTEESEKTGAETDGGYQGKEKKRRILRDGWNATCRGGLRNFGLYSPSMPPGSWLIHHPVVESTPLSGVLLFVCHSPAVKATFIHVWKLSA